MNILNLDNSIEVATCYFFELKRQNFSSFIIYVFNYYLWRSPDSNGDESKGYLILITHFLSIMQSIGLQYITHIPFYALRATLRLPIPPLRQ